MFQNISKQIDTDEIIEEKNENRKDKLKYIAQKLFTKQNIVIYILSLLVSQVNCAGTMAPFGLAIFAAAVANGIPSGIIYVMTLIRIFYWFWKKWTIKLFSNITCIYY